MPQVIAIASSYDYARLREDVFRMLSRLDRGGIGRGSRVVIKPNLLASSDPAQAVTTHPLLVRATAEYALSLGAEVQVSDSPPLGSFDKIVRDCGVLDALEGLPVEVRPFGPVRRVEIRGRWRRMELSAEALDADVLINLPKLKTHTQMTLTLAVKNLFGCVVGMQKPEWHFRVGEDRDAFAEMLASVYLALRPVLNIMDGILAMEGAGPGKAGTPRSLGMLIGGDDALCVDHAVCGMLGLPPLDLPTNGAAARLGCSAGYELHGQLPEVSGFLFPEATEMVFGPRVLRGFLRRHMARRPETVKGACRLCNECVRICPAGAVSGIGKKLVFDYDRCIRCYCCLEVCPHGAIISRDTVVKRSITKALKVLKGG